MAEIRYIGKNGGHSKPPTPEQKEREGSDDRLAAAKAREREAIATLRETELARRRGELTETSVFVREAQDVCVVIRSRFLLLPTQLARKCAGKSQHEIKTIIDAGIREVLTELSKFGTYFANTRRRKRKEATK